VLGAAMIFFVWLRTGDPEWPTRAMIRPSAHQQDQMA
jgi:hypothetical protein